MAVPNCPDRFASSPNCSEQTLACRPGGKCQNHPDWQGSWTRPDWAPGGTAVVWDFGCHCFSAACCVERGRF
ncbi:hypothetical protein BpHYR1_027048 [Brachionus plicatilis]|uniref:Uncharacterized protein n=1 Tax=Brachionus plicatilis TaxID=10195 RepID=A0A3M7PTT5_BRAPC|nr:hypothetical protein BpHYR1_027048 [Brachionus plicatilis]